MEITNSNMQKLIIKIDWCEKNYSASLVSNEIGVIIATAKTEAEAKDKFHEALKFHIDGMIADNDTVPSYLSNNEYEFVYEYTLSATLHNIQQYTSLTAISKVTGIKHAQLSHYANAVSRPKQKQKDRIINGLHQIGRECLAVK